MSHHDECAASSFDVTVTFDTDVVCVEVEGELDVATALRLRDHLDLAIACSTSAVVVDMAAVPFIDSAGLFELLTTRRRLEAAGRRFHVRNPSPQVLQVFELTGVTELLARRGPPRAATSRPRGRRGHLGADVLHVARVHVDGGH